MIGTPKSTPGFASRRTFLLNAMAGVIAGQCCEADAQEQRFAPDGFVAVRKGALPIIISAPHGGEMEIPGVPARTGEGLKKGPSGFFAGRDVNTELLAAAIAKAIEARLGKSPYSVISKAHRKYVDPNRPIEIAVEHPRAREVYDVYHAALAKFCDEVQKRFGRGLVLDIHGQGSARDTVFRGTQNGRTDAMLVKLCGEKVHAGPQSLAGLIAARGIDIQPTDDSREKEGLTGGYIVVVYGRREGIGAVQLEFGADFRTKENIGAVAEKLADGIVDFAKLYLLANPEPKK
jgi:N-formylglutamate amidohydrolase